MKKVYLFCWKCDKLHTAFVGLTFKDPEERWKYTLYNRGTPQKKKNRLGADLANTDPDYDWDRSIVGVYTNIVKAALEEEKMAKELKELGYKLYKRSHGDLVIFNVVTLKPQELMKQCLEALKDVPLEVLEP
jgi:hypothetical protein